MSSEAETSCIRFSMIWSIAVDKALQRSGTLSVLFWDYVWKVFFVLTLRCMMSLEAKTSCIRFSMIWSIGE
ncbi:hypothetical protein QOT17_008913 [Balamuthia mandrillaris]